MIYNKIRAILAALTLAAGFAGQAEAGFVGNIVGMQNRFPTVDRITNDFGTALVAPAASFDLSDNPVRFLVATVTDTRLVIENISTSTIRGYATGGIIQFNGYGLTTSSGPEISGISLNALSSVVGFTADRLSFSPRGAFLDFQGLTILQGQEVVVDFAFTPAAVPEPSSLALCGIAGLSGLGYAWSRRKLVPAA